MIVVSSGGVKWKLIDVLVSRRLQRELRRRHAALREEASAPGAAEAKPESPVSQYALDNAGMVGMRLLRARFLRLRPVPQSQLPHAMTDLSGDRCDVANAASTWRRSPSPRLARPVDKRVTARTRRSLRAPRPIPRPARSPSQFEAVSWPTARVRFNSVQRRAHGTSVLRPPPSRQFASGGSRYASPLHPRPADFLSPGGMSLSYGRSSGNTEWLE